MKPESQFGDQDLDHILLDQYHTAKRVRKAGQKTKKLMPNDPLVIQIEMMIDKRIQFYESMICDKSLLKKKHKKRKTKEADILARNPVVDWYKMIFMTTTFGYRMMVVSVSEYMSYFKRGK